MTNINSFDWMLAKSRPWDTIGKNTFNAKTAEEAITAAGLDWDVVQVPCFADGQEIPGYYANVRSDTGAALGVVQGRYKIAQNRQAFSLLDDIVQQNDIPCTFEAAGSILGGRRVWAMVKMPSINIVGDVVDQFLYLTNSHDGTSSFQAGLSHIRLACTNAMKMMFRNAISKWTARHTASMSGRHDEAIRVLGLAHKYQDTMIQEMERLARQRIDINKFAQLLFPAKEDANKRSQGSVEEQRFRLITLHNEKDDLANLRGTAYGVLSAVSDMISNTRPLRVTENSADRKLANFFDGYPLLDKAQKLLEEVAA